jgi:predicted nucleotidyltransferase
MRLTPTQIDTIHSTTQAVLGEGAKVTLFGSRVDDQARGGDVDLMIEVSQALAEPALMSARIASCLSRAFVSRVTTPITKLSPP